ncbi:MAG: hypothetical protein Q4D78_05170 [Neisseria zoodegmatis]|uniref:MATE family Na+-driven efflux transporter n=1 Tax=Neisseria zoodegmatis TaxID=326523 RepID=UPI0026ED9734|nr:MATE family Na+-driven efflux transporter [Neisseria zoodegmatis]MDO5069579.1 hypothetical protein [Neisseria zoodegmatis]
MKTFDFKLWFAFVLVILIPSLVNIIRLHFIGDMPNEWGFNIASQIQWLNILYEIVKETFLIPLFFMLSQALKENQEKLVNNAVCGLLLVTVVHILISAGVFLFAEPLLISAKQSGHLIADTVEYIKLESIAILLSVVTEYLIVYLAIMQDFKRIIQLSLLKLGLLVGTDILLVSNMPVSLKLGVNGIALSNIIINALLAVFVLSHHRIKTFFSENKLRFDRSWFKDWLKLGAFSGLESLVRNAAFALMILAMVNQIGEQGSYWVANNIIWGILLVPSLALAEVVKRDVARSVDNIRTHTLAYIKLSVLFAGVWLISIPVWESFLVHVLKMENPNTVLEIMLIQTGFYIVFMFNNSILDATIQGLGITRYMLYQSIIVNIGYYGAIFVLYQYDMIQMSLLSISLIFGIGMLIDMIPTVWLYLKTLRKHGIRLADIVG